MPSQCRFLETPRTYVLGSSSENQHAKGMQRMEVGRELKDDQTPDDASRAEPEQRLAAFRPAPRKQGPGVFLLMHSPVWQGQRRVKSGWTWLLGR